ncbi:MAG: phosphohydrolase [Anaerolineaceae bacterium]|nr:phosphohydrolase [Anaerolineaceae bacterium]
MTVNWSQDVYDRALRYAANAHHGQKFRRTELPYLIHPTLACMEVIAALAEEDHHDGNLAVQCALLHDVLEDTHIFYEDLQKQFGTDVADGVLALSKDKSLPESEQMADSLLRIQKQPSAVWIVKLGDRISNLSEPPEWWTTEKKVNYQESARQIYDALHTASPFMARRMKDKITAYGKYIGK